MKRITFFALAIFLSGCASMVGTDINDYDYSVWEEEEPLARHCGKEVKKNHHFRKGSMFALQDFSRYVADCMAKLKQQRRIVGADYNNPKVTSFNDPSGTKTYQATCNYENEPACYRVASNSCQGGKYQIVRYEIWGNGIRSDQSGNNLTVVNNVNVNIGYANKIYGNSGKRPQYIRSTWQCK